MQYIMFINDVEADQAGPQDPSFGEYMAEFDRFNDMVESQGISVSSGRLAPSTSATTVRVRDGEVLTSDGPFADTKEQIGGYWILECRDLDHAIELAAKIPTVRHGSIEVRPMWSGE